MNTNEEQELKAWENEANERFNDNNNSFNGSFNYVDDTEYVIPNRTQNLILRFVGNLPTTITREPYVKGDSVEFNEVELKGPDGKVHKFRYHLTVDPTQQPHLLERAYNAITAKEDKNFLYAETDAFVAATTGNIPVGSPGHKFGSKGLKPCAYFTANVIDRSDDWCKTNKKTKVLASYCGKVKDEKKGTIIKFPQFFKSQGSLSKLYGNIYKFYRTMDLDIGFILNGDKYSPLNVYNLTGMKESNFTQSVAPFTDLSKVALGPLTEEEKAYEVVDLLQKFKDTRWQTIQKNAGWLIEDIDRVCGTQFAFELERECAAEMKADEERKAQKKAAAENSTTETEASKVQNIYENAAKAQPAPTNAGIVQPNTAPSFNEMSAVPTREEVPAREEIPARAVVEENKYNISVEEQAMIPTWSTLDEKDKMFILGVSKTPEGKLEIKFAPEAGKLARCVDATCTQASPQRFHSCPLCGKKFV